MKKLLIPFILGAAIGLGAATAAVGYFDDEEPTIEDGLNSAMAGDDSVALDAEVAEHSDSTGSAEVAPERDTTAALPEQLDDAAAALIEPGTAASMGDEDAAQSANAMGSTRLAELFASMQAREAARVLEHMDDFEVQTILTQLGNREAAAILSNLTPERAAVISRSVIRGERSTP
ncbi:MAG: hypothetical protein WD737_10565 [Gemmatimonadota bacterium]